MHAHAYQDPNWTKEHLKDEYSNNDIKHSSCPNYIKVTNPHRTAHKVQHMNEAKTKEHKGYTLHTCSKAYLTQVDNR